MKNKMFLTLVLGGLLCLAGWTAHAQLQNTAPAKRAWEYIEVQLDAGFPTNPKLNQYGAQGWELVGVTSICPASNDSTIACRSLAYFKRAK